MHHLVYDIYTRAAIIDAKHKARQEANRLRQAKVDGMNPKDFFSKYGREQIEIGCPWFTVEEMYQAFKARMMEEMETEAKKPTRDYQAVDNAN